MKTDIQYNIQVSSNTKEIQEKIENISKKVSEVQALVEELEKLKIYCVIDWKSD